MKDSDGHARSWQLDATSRVTQTSAWTGRQWLVTRAAWDAKNNIAGFDARGNETEYVYELNGNTVAVQLPAVQTTAGFIRPTSLLSYDAYSNVVAQCDADYVVANPGLGSAITWSTHTGPDALCPSGYGTTHYTWDLSDRNEPAGRLLTAYDPMGYTRERAQLQQRRGNVDARLRHPQSQNLHERSNGRHVLDRLQYGRLGAKLTIPDTTREQCCHHLRL